MKLEHALSALLLIVAPLAAGAQHTETSLPAYVSPQDHWRVYTDPDQRLTRVQFFDDQHRLLYEETLPGQYLKLTPRNVRKLNETHARLRSNHLLSTTLQVSALPDLPAPAHLTPTRFQAHVFAVAGTARFKVTFDNPERDVVQIWLKDAQGHTLHHDKVQARSYVRSFNLTPLPSGDYQVEIKRGRTVQKQTVSLAWERVTLPSLQVEETPPPPADVPADDWLL
ncbi:hypothetical protein SAMN05421823_106223 [Catalinimonas alkaloidigena]|uniref:Por secretion system C-terminal sorting domain-containing protein n=1 Tax=Catalinimonas alkaloidigena TaxID=1075417 RepID=A0A1G9KPA8_9BACT|nr:hypothetical protein [Catalinimonas alkaloidigena]SDL51618.1 hypothetical protein SAMN05421823_106223 [Catalinimonas alkaloidigena]